MVRLPCSPLSKTHAGSPQLTPSHPVPLDGLLAVVSSNALSPCTGSERDCPISLANRTCPNHTLSAISQDQPSTISAALFSPATAHVGATDVGPQPLSPWPLAIPGLEPDEVGRSICNLSPPPAPNATHTHTTPMTNGPRVHTTHARPLGLPTSTRSRRRRLDAAHPCLLIGLLLLLSRCPLPMHCHLATVKTNLANLSSPSNGP